MKKKRKLGKTNEQYIAELKSVYGDKYDYSEVKYGGSHVKVKVICPKHGAFEKEPNRMFRNPACKECYYESITSDTNTFIEKANKIHNNKYIYSLVHYKNNYDKIIIICPIHGEFLQTPKSHLIGNGCPDCCKTKKSTTEKFIEKAIKIHGDKYEYTSVNYIDSHVYVDIICKIHGVFKQTPTNHLSGFGCNSCGCEITRSKGTMSNLEFIEKAKKIHSETYDYSDAIYAGWNNMVTIICKQHGAFKQLGGSHLCGKGCKLCKNSKGELAIAKILDKYDVKYIREKKFDGCKNRLPLAYDFYIYNLNKLLEYDGRQHYDSIEYFGGDKGFTRRQINDEIKNNFAKDNNIDLLRIRYDEIKNMENIIYNYLNLKT